MKTAIVTGANGGMGTEITKELERVGYNVIKVCLHKTDDSQYQCDLSEMNNIVTLVKQLRMDINSVELLMNNAGTMCTHFQQTAEGFERTVAVNYLAPFLLTHLLLPLMHEGTRVVNMVSCTYAIGKVGPHFFSRGREAKGFWRIPIYSNTKYALWMFTYEMAMRLKDKGITVNAADPGVVSTDIIRMDMWFDPLTDIFYRPFIRTPRQGADTAIRLLLDDDKEKETGNMYHTGRLRHLRPQFTDRKTSLDLYNKTYEVLKDHMNCL